MKTHQTLYEILEVPANARFNDIRAAFREIQAVYDKDSLSTYSLFSAKEREKILDQARKAFHTLCDPEKREAYDQSLVDEGRLSQEMRFQYRRKKPEPVFVPAASGPPGPGAREAAAKVRGKDFIRLRDDIQARDRISGQDLRALRQAAGISLADIHELSRISLAQLKAVETQDKARLPSLIYLKGFLKAYARVLDLSEEIIVKGYLSQVNTL